MVIANKHFWGKKENLDIEMGHLVSGGPSSEAHDENTFIKRTNFQRFINKVKVAQHSSKTF